MSCVALHSALVSLHRICCIALYTAPCCSSLNHIALHQISLSFQIIDQGRFAAKKVVKLTDGQIRPTDRQTDRYMEYTENYSTMQYNLMLHVEKIEIVICDYNSGCI